MSGGEAGRRGGRRVPTPFPPSRDTPPYPRWPAYNPNYGKEPYWTLGEWVFKPMQEVKKKKSENKTITDTPLVCYDECEPMYVAVGPVCVRKKIVNYTANIGCVSSTRDDYNTFRFVGCYGLQHDNYTHAFITFNSYCDFLTMVCATPGPDNMIPERYFLVHIGPCMEPQGNLYRLPYDDVDTRDFLYYEKSTLTPLPNLVASRKDDFEERFRKIYKIAIRKEGKLSL